MTEALEQLVDSLLYEGYALYPYTREATKNATPTPFGIVYPPAYAAELPSAFDHLEMACRLERGERVEAEVRFLAATGHRHQAEPHRIVLPPGIPQLELRVGELSLRLTLTSGAGRVAFRVQNLTDAPRGLDRASALRRSLISAHPILRARGGRFTSPLEAGLASVNTWPVLASADDDVMLGAAIVLPDHPALAPESLGNLFDSTEIEEALLLHVQVLSDEERASIEAQDPAVREMIARASATTPEELLALHGRVEVRDRVTTEPPAPSAAVRDPSAGEAEATYHGVTFRKGGKVTLRPGPGADLHARMLDGHPATIERIFTALDGRVHLAVTVDDDPGQELMRETGRFLFFFPPEVELR